MILLLPSLLLFTFCVLLFIREVSLDRKKFLDKKRLANEHVLREVERFKKEMKVME